MVTLALTLTAVPAYLWYFDLDAFQVALFFFMFSACGLSITLGYHRLFSHRSFEAHWLVRFLVLIFGAGAFENSALLWSCEHRTHHKHVDHDEDPYDSTKGLFYAHIGWLLFKEKLVPPFDNVKDLLKDRMVMWQHRNIHLLAAIVAFVFPAVLGFAWGGWQSALGAFLIGGVARVVALQHCTFCINSLCHYIGDRPYSTRCTARDSWIMALVTFGEGYHNFHHEFQHDYRNGVKPWQFDPTKWTIWTLSKLGLASKLRRVPAEKIAMAELREAQDTLAAKALCPDLPAAVKAYLAGRIEHFQTVTRDWYEEGAVQMEELRAVLAELREEIRMIGQLPLATAE